MQSVCILASRESAIVLGRGTIVDSLDLLKVVLGAIDVGNGLLERDNNNARRDRLPLEAAGGEVLDALE